MCWMHNPNPEPEDPEPLEVVSFPTCQGCKRTLAKDAVHEYDLFKRFRELAEFVNQKRFVFFCRDCIEEMDKYYQYLLEQKPMPDITIPVTWEYESRYIKKSNHIPVGIHCTAQQVTLGLRCAKQIYGYDATEEILQGFIYHDDEGHQIKRLTSQDVDETIRCDKCWLRLDECNSMERTI